MKQVDKSKHIPAYIQIKESILEDIRSGVLRPDQQMLSEPKLAEAYGVNRLTARSAVTELVNEGYLNRIHGLGTFVRRPRIESSNSYVTSFLKEMQTKGYTVDTFVMERKIVEAPRMIRFALGPKASDVYYIKRRRAVNKEMLVVLESYIPVELCPGLLKKDLSLRSLYEILVTDYNLTPSQARERMEAQTAGKQLSEDPMISVGDPVLFSTRLAVLDTGEPVEYTNTWYRGDRYAFEVNLEIKIDI